ncbi:hypothetical protein DQ237_11785 [Blastococcus sp. TF02-8]|uniref:hypothetical protein n=1 Tax=Blastococcus sp. TF02-8 TaxID=2250574 RepID=UPI000DEB7FB1|nr:hypothetical protein [Blastococcus sp. TF02-8]RBY95823.1 hypothetical protein DQ237_11785 [Blastococcus sp. TF02-8]
MSRRILATALLPLCLVVAGCAGTEAPDASEPTATTSGAAESSASSSAPADDARTSLAVEVAGGQVTGDTGRVPVALGDRVTISITSDTADEAHLHGYDVETALSPGTPAQLNVDATIPGVFELELHESGTVLLTLQVG